MKNKYNFGQKKTNITSVPPLDWTWYEKFDYLFAKATKIDGVLKGVDKKMHIIFFLRLNL
jgi:hypothetical protein